MTHVIVSGIYCRTETFEPVARACIMFNPYLKYHTVDEVVARMKACIASYVTRCDCENYAGYVATGGYMLTFYKCESRWEVIASFAPHIFKEFTQ